MVVHQNLVACSDQPEQILVSNDFFYASVQHNSDPERQLSNC